MRRSIAVALLFAGTCAAAGCRRHHAPPAWTPSLRAGSAEPPPAPALAAPAGLASSPGSLPAPPPFQAPIEARPARPAPPALVPDGGELAVAHGALDGGTVNGHPRGPRAEALEGVVRSVVPAIQRCLDAEPEIVPGEVKVRVSYRIVPAGRATNVEVVGALPAGGLACVRSAVEALRFAEFEGDDVAGTFPFTYRREPPRLAPPPQP